MDYLMFWGAVVSALALVAVAFIQGFTLFKVGQMQAHAAIQTVATTAVQTDVKRIEVNTNSISERLEALAKAQGVQIGRAERDAEIALRDKNIAVGKTLERVEQAAKTVP